MSRRIEKERHSTKKEDLSVSVKKLVIRARHEVCTESKSMEYIERQPVEAM